jgi:hypothetical protein
MKLAKRSGAMSMPQFLASTNNREASIVASQHHRFTARISRLIYSSQGE